MKSFATLTLLAWYSSASAQGLHLLPGQSFSYSFDPSALPFIADLGGSIPPPSGVRVFLAGDLLDSGESLRLELFSDSGATTVFAADLVAGATPALADFAARASGLFWADREGALRLTMVSGEATVDRFALQVIAGTRLYGGVVPVPEPGTHALFGLALASLALWRATMMKWTKRKQIAATRRRGGACARAPVPLRGSRPLARRG